MNDLNRLSYDVSRCTGDNCQRKEQCARFMAPHGLYQSIVSFLPHQLVHGCGAFISNGKPIP